MKSSDNFSFSAEYYDLLYNDKNYEHDADFVEEVFAAFGKPTTILEVGCGTGNYTRLLRKRGYDVLGLDISEEMIKIARGKCDNVFQVGDMRSCSLDRKFDACVALFAVMGYMVENSDVMSALRNIRAHLKPGGLFVFDMWNGLAVLRILPDARVKKVENSECTVQRVATPTLNSRNHLCVVDYNYSVLNKKTQILQESSESHRVRFYFPQEISFFLEQAGFEVLKICPFLDLSGVVDETVWNMAVIARAV